MNASCTVPLSTFLGDVKFGWKQDGEVTSGVREGFLSDQLDLEFNLKPTAGQGTSDRKRHAGSQEGSSGRRRPCLLAA